MSISLKKVKLLFQRDMVDLVHNPNIFIVCLVPVIFCLIYSKIGILADGVLYMISIMNMCMVPLMLSSSTIAEEKEKNTLRTLMLSNISAGEFLMSKALMSVVMFGLTGMIIYISAGASLSHLIGYVFISMFCSIPIILLGCTIGMISRDQMTCGLYQVPVMLIIMLPTMLASVNKTVEKFAQIMPTNAYVTMFTRLINEKFLDEKIIFHFAVILIWTLATTAVFYLCYKKNLIDN